MYWYHTNDILKNNDHPLIAIILLDYLFQSSAFFRAGIELLAAAETALWDMPRLLFVLKLREAGSCGSCLFNIYLDLPPL